MQWYEYKRFPLTLDLTAAHAFLVEQNVAHKFIENNAEQVLYLASLEQRDAIDIFFTRLLSGELTLEAQGNLRVEGMSRVQLLQRFSVVRSQLGVLPVTFLLLILGGLGYCFTALYPSQSVFAFSHFVSFAELLQGGQLWRLFTPIFLHFDINHIVFNALWVYLFGRVIEPYLGSLRYSALILWIALCSNFCQYLVSGHGQFGGLSGVAYGLVAYAGVGYLRFGVTHLAFLPALFVLSVCTMVLGFIGGLDWLAGAKIANWAHLAGFCTGGAVAFIQFFNRSRILK